MKRALSRMMSMMNTVTHLVIVSESTRVNAITIDETATIPIILEIVSIVIEIETMINEKEER
jgi:hypothetical protein